MKKSILLLLPLLLSVSCNITTENSQNQSNESEHTDTSKDEPEVVVLDDNYRNFYEIFVYSYADSNGDKIGDLNGITSKLDYISSLGYTGIWLTPIFSSNTYHKYDAVDYFKIDESFGTIDDLKNLVSKAHSLNIKVILDGVFNHSSFYNSWFESALIAKRKILAKQEVTEEERNYASLYTFYDTLEEARNSHKQYYQAGGNNFYYEANFDRMMPEFNFDSEFTYEKIESVIDYYMSDEIGVDGFRLDAVKYYYMNDTTKNIKVLNRIAKMIKDNDPKGYAVGECWDAAGTINQYYQSDIDSYFYFPANGQQGFVCSSCNLEGEYKYTYYDGAKALLDNADGKIPAPFLNNHDTGRVSSAGNMGIVKFRLGLLGMLNGATFNYYGDELGMSSANVSGGDYVDSNYRTHYYWDDETHDMETKDAPNAKVQNEDYPASKTQLADPDSILNYAKNINFLRLKQPMIARGELIENDAEDEANNNNHKKNLLVMKKRYNNKNYKIVINFSAFYTENYSIGSYTFEDAVTMTSGEKVNNSDGIISLPPHAIAVLAE